MLFYNSHNQKAQFTQFKSIYYLTSEMNFIAQERCGCVRPLVLIGKNNVLDFCCFIMQYKIKWIKYFVCVF